MDLASGAWTGSEPPSAIQGARTAQVPPPLLFFDVATGKWKSPMEMHGLDVLSTSNPPHEHMPEPSVDKWPRSRLADALERLNQIENLDANWDSYGSQPPTQVALETAGRLIGAVYEDTLSARPRAAVPYSVIPLSGGGVQVEWRGNSAAIEVEISSEAVLGYLLARGSEPSREFEEADNVSQPRILQLIRDVI
jgi:hypothetical protein